MEFFAGMFGLVIGLQFTVLGIALALLPIFWVWMLVDAILRDDTEYPGDDENEKLVWVLVVALVQPAAILYFFMVYRKIKRAPAQAAPEGLPVQQ